MHELVRRLRSGELSCREVVQHHLAALHALNETNQAVEWFGDEGALAHATRLDAAFAASGPVGPLHGLPITVKDWIDVAGLPCSGGDASHRDRWPKADATVVSRLRMAGAVVLAKTVAWAPTADGIGAHHPLDPGRSASGSSTGEAIVTAVGVSPLGVGSDSGGSIRLPAAWCGVHGFKPSAGLVPTTGHFPRVGALSDGRTQIGPMSSDLGLLAAALQVIAGPDGHDPGALPIDVPWGLDPFLGTATFAVVTGEGGDTPSGAVLAAVEAAAERLLAAGLRRVDWPTVWLGAARDITQRYWDRVRSTGADAERQLWDWDVFRRRHLEASADIDFILAPVADTTAPLARPIVADDFVHTLPASLTGSPAMSVAVGRASDGLPVAVQLIGRRFEDHRLLALAQRLVE